MNAPLAINTAYRAYTSGVAVPGMGYEQYYWPSPEEKAQEPVHSSEGGPPPEALSDVEEKAPHKNPSKSPRGRAPLLIFWRFLCLGMGASSLSTRV